MFINMVLNIIGSMRIRILVSSTCVTVHRFQGPEGVDTAAPVLLLAIAARSKNLGIHVANKTK